MAVRLPRCNAVQVVGALRPASRSVGSNRAMRVPQILLFRLLDGHRLAVDHDQQQQKKSEGRWLTADVPGGSASAGVGKRSEAEGETANSAGRFQCGNEGSIIIQAGHLCVIVFFFFFPFFCLAGTVAARPLHLCTHQSALGVFVLEAGRSDSFAVHRGGGQDRSR